MGESSIFATPNVPQRSMNFVTPSMEALYTILYTILLSLSIQSTHYTKINVVRNMYVVVLRYIMRKEMKCNGSGA